FSLYFFLVCLLLCFFFFFFFSSRRRHTRSKRDWSSDVCSSDLFRIVVDYGYSATSFVLPLVLGQIGVEAVSAHGFSQEGTQGTPSLRESVGQAKRLVNAIGRSEERRVGKECRAWRGGEGWRRRV